VASNKSTPPSLLRTCRNKRLSLPDSMFDGEPITGFQTSGDIAPHLSDFFGG
jgi:hypothetical protein